MSGGAKAIALVDRYLQHCEDRELDSASALWAPGPVLLEFPGAVVYHSLQELVEASRLQYSWVRKNRDEYAASVSEGQVTVTSVGRLYGENLHGIAFEDVRYIDVFTIVEAGIRSQRVWNDLSVSGVLQRSD